MHWYTFEVYSASQRVVSSFPVHLFSFRFSPYTGFEFFQPYSCESKIDSDPTVLLRPKSVCDNSPQLMLIRFVAVCFHHFDEHKFLPVIFMKTETRYYSIGDEVKVALLEVEVVKMMPRLKRFTKTNYITIDVRGAAWGGVVNLFWHVTAVLQFYWSMLESDILKTTPPKARFTVVEISPWALKEGNM